MKNSNESCKCGHPAGSHDDGYCYGPDGVSYCSCRVFTPTDTGAILIKRLKKVVNQYKKNRIGIADLIDEIEKFYEHS